MRQTLAVLNDLERKGFILRYAIAGAVAAVAYIEAFETEDLDVFVMVKASKHALLPFDELYQELRRRGYSKDGIYDIIEGIPVQFLPAIPQLVAEAVNEARVIDYEGVPARVPSPEHLVAIMVYTGRAKDRLRMQQMREQADLDLNRLDKILEQYGLQEKYSQWTRDDN